MKSFGNQNILSRKHWLW